MNDRPESSLLPLAPGGFADVTSDPTTDRGYRSAVEETAFFERRDRNRLRVSGRAPRQMLNGILTGTLPAPRRRDRRDSCAAPLPTMRS